MRIGLSKLGNIPTIVDGIRFSSKREAKRWTELLLLQKAGRIKDLQRQVSFRLDVNKMHICRYFADFVYTENGHAVVEDAKGRRGGLPYDMFRLKAKLMLAVHGIAIVEV